MCPLLLKRIEANGYVGIRIHIYLKANGITQKWLADRMGYNQRKTLSVIMHGHRNISYEEYQRICRFLDLPPEYFLDDDRVLNLAAVNKNAYPERLSLFEKIAQVLGCGNASAFSFDSDREYLIGAGMFVNFYGRFLSKTTFADYRDHLLGETSAHGLTASLEACLLDFTVVYTGGELDFFIDALRSWKLENDTIDPGALVVGLSMAMTINTD